MNNSKQGLTKFVFLFMRIDLEPARNTVEKQGRRRVGVSMGNIKRKLM